MSRLPGPICFMAMSRGPGTDDFRETSEKRNVFQAG